MFLRSRLRLDRYPYFFILSFSIDWTVKVLLDANDTLAILFKTYMVRCKDEHLRLETFCRLTELLGQEWYLHSCCPVSFLLFNIESDLVKACSRFLFHSRVNTVLTHWNKQPLKTCLVIIVTYYYTTMSIFQHLELSCLLDEPYQDLPSWLTFPMLKTILFAVTI